MTKTDFVRRAQQKSPQKKYETKTSERSNYKETLLKSNRFRRTDLSNKI